MMTFNFDISLGAWAPAQLHQALKALDPLFVGLSTAVGEEANDKGEPVPFARLILYYGDEAIPPNEQDILALLASAPPALPPPAPTVEQRLSKLETDVADLKARPSR